MASLTVTATQSGANPFNGILLSVRVLNSAQAAASQTGATAHAANTTVSLTTTTTGSVCYGAAADSAGTAFTGILASSTQIAQDNDATNGATYATWKAAAATGTPGATNFGWSTPGATDINVAAEILASGTIAEDGSTPASVSDNLHTFVTTASFNPPSGSLLVAIVATDTGGVPESVTISDTASLTWHQRIFQNGAAFMGAGVWVADAPSGTATAAPGFTGRRAPPLPARARQRTFERVPPGVISLGQYPGEFTGRHPVWPPPTRGRVRVVVPSGNQVTAPPSEFTGRHPVWPPPRRGRVFLPVPPGIQVTPPQPYSVFFTHRPLAALPLRRGKIFQPVPAGVTVIIPPPSFSHGRYLLGQQVAATRRGRAFAPPLPLIVQTPGTSIAIFSHGRYVLGQQSALPRRGRSFVPTYPATPFVPVTGIQRWLGATHIVDYTFPYPGLGSRHIGGTDYQYDGEHGD